MLIEVRQPYVDIRAGDLSLTLGAPPAPAIEALCVTAGGYEIELRLLGSSHQALVEGCGALSETVACASGVPGSLPQRRIHGPYAFRARVEKHSAEGYAALSGGVLASAADDAWALAGVFPPAPGTGDRDRAPMPAFTALAVRPPASGAGITWLTWHGYPQSGEIVFTASSLERPR